MKRPLRRPRYRWVSNTDEDLQKIGCEDVGWINQAQDWVKWHAFVKEVPISLPRTHAQKAAWTEIM